MKLYCADCMDILKGIPEGSIDMILCDLPYGTTRNKWDIIIPLEPLWAQYRRIIKSNGRYSTAQRYAIYSGPCKRWERLVPV